METALKEAILKFGGPTKLAAALGITEAAVRQWKRCPQRHVEAIEMLTGKGRHELRPDKYPVALSEPAGISGP